MRGEKNQKRVEGRVERQEMTVTAQLMPGHEMALPQIMTERALEKEKERGNSSDLDRMLGGSWRVGGGVWRGNKSRYC